MPLMKPAGLLKLPFPSMEIIFMFNDDRFHATRFSKFISKQELAFELHCLADNIANDGNLK